MATNVAPYFSDDWLTIYGGDCREVLASLPSDSVDCVVTSPPYWGLRDYGTATWEGGDAGCDHLVGPPASGSNTLNGGKGWTPTAYGIPHKGDCGKCGAVRIDSQLGLERTPEEYVANMVSVFAEVRRVLKPSGTCWLNLGDSYSGGKTDRDDNDINRRNLYDGSTAEQRVGRKLKDNPAGRQRPVPPGLKPKDLVGIPWRVAFALQADGWYLRSDIIWSKPNPMPESVTDRPTKAHEYLFLLTKSARYYFDADAVREAPADPNRTDFNPGKRVYSDEYAAAIRPGWVRQNGFGKSGKALSEYAGAGRNIRSVWNIATRPYPGAHFAVFPPELPERCIKAGSPTPGTVLDPFAGSGTVGMVANRLSRRAILIDLNPEYLEQQLKRNAQTPLGLGA